MQVSIIILALCHYVLCLCNRVFPETRPSTILLAGTHQPLRKHKGHREAMQELVVVQVFIQGSKEVFEHADHVLYMKEATPSSTMLVL